MVSEQSWVRLGWRLCCSQMKLEGFSSSFGTSAGTVVLPEEKELETHPLVPLLFQSSCHGSSGDVCNLSFKLLLDSAAGAPSGACCSSEVVSAADMEGFFCFFQREGSVVGLKRKNESLEAL